MAWDQTCMGFAVGLNRAECASWVQAWGSVLAICAAIAIAVWQKRQDRRKEDERDRRHALQQMDTLVALAEFASALIEAIPSAGADEATTKAYIDKRQINANVVGTALREFGPGDVPDGSALVHTLELIRCCAEAEAERERSARHYWARPTAYGAADYVPRDATLADIRLRVSASVGMLRYLRRKYMD